MKIKMFVYGTLRPGQYNSLRTGAEDGATVIARDVRIPGRMKPVSKSGGYPIVDVVTETDSTIEGDILELDPNGDEFHKIVLMEVGARYVPVMVSVWTGWKQSHNCLVWHYPDFEDRGTKLIESGDWPEWEAALQNA